MLLNNYFRGLYFEKDGGGGGGGDDDDDKAKKPEKKINFLEWLKTAESVNDEVREAYELHTQGLKGALGKERDTNKDAKKLLAALGKVEGVDVDPDKIPDVLKEYKTLKEEAQKRADADKSEMEKLSEKIEALKAELETAKADKEQVNNSLASERKMYAIVTEAARMGFADPADAYQLADKSSVTFEEGKDGEAGTWEGVKEALEALVEAKPYLLSENDKQPKTKGTPKGGDKTTQKKGSQEEQPVKTGINF